MPSRAFQGVNVISVKEAYAIVQAHLPNWGEYSVPVENIFSEMTAEPLLADRDYPPFHRVMMDGICVSWRNYEAGLREFKVAGVCAAGSPRGQLIDHQSCLEVMTGAPLPEGAGLVIPYEHLQIENGLAKLTVEQDRSYLEHVHLQGSDCKQGEVLLRAGEKLNGPHLGIAASLGYSKIKCLRKPKIKIISTGDELVEVHRQPLAHQIRRSNAHALKASLLEYGYHDVDLDHVPDNLEKLRNHYSQNAGVYDLLIYSGGVSKGQFDYLPRMWEEMGVKKHFHEVSQRPGKPLWFGTDEQTQTLVVGLPGNPVSSLVCLHRYFLPRRKMSARLTSDIVFEKNLTLFVPVTIQFNDEGGLLAIPHKIKNSGEFSALAGSDGFIELSQERSHFKEGECYQFFGWGRL